MRTKTCPKTGYTYKPAAMTRVLVACLAMDAHAGRFSKPEISAGIRDIWRSIKDVPPASKAKSGSGK